MRKFISLFVLISFTLSVSAQKDATEYNDIIIDEQTKIGEKIVNFSNAQTNEDMDLALKILEKQVGVSIETLNNLGGWNGDKDFLNSAHTLFNFYKEIASSDYRKMLDILIHEELTEEDVEKLNIIAADISAREKAFDDDFAIKQEEFAKRNGFTLAPVELQETIDEDY